VPLHEVAAYLDAGNFADLTDARGWEEGQTVGLCDRLAPPTLSSGHTGPVVDRELSSFGVGVIEDPYVEVAVGGNVARVHIPRGPVERAAPPRGECHGFSGKSRLALLQDVNGVNQGLCLPSSWAFGTLTYPLGAPEPRIAKQHLRAFRKRWERRWGKCCGWWKLEPQKRGAPHFHLLLYLGWGVNCIAEIASWAAQAWHEIAGQGDPNHLRWHQGGFTGRPCFEQVNDWAGVSRYAGKYFGKVYETIPDWPWSGRFWGCWRRSSLPIEWQRQYLSPSQAVVLSRELRRLKEHQATGKYRMCGLEAVDQVGGYSRSVRRNRCRRNDCGVLVCEVGAVQRLRLDLAGVSEWREKYGKDVRPIRYRCRRGRSFGGREHSDGVSAFVGYVTLLRLLKWAKGERPESG